MAETIAAKDIVRLRGTSSVYRVREIYQTYEGENNLNETWCRLVKKGGVEAYWKLVQLELVSKFEQKETNGSDRN